MRAHGVHTFPDPIAPGAALPGTNSYLGDGPDPSNSPTYDAASTACRKYAVASPVTPAGAAKVMAQQLGYARCIRAHGVLDFPDPSPGGGFTIPSSIDESTPAFRRAAAACSGLLAEPPGLGTSGS